MVSFFWITFLRLVKNHFFDFALMTHFSPFRPNDAFSGVCVCVCVCECVCVCVTVNVLNRWSDAALERVETMQTSFNEQLSELLCCKKKWWSNPQNLGNVEKLIYPMVESIPTIKYYAATTEIFNILHKVHLKIWHGGWNRRVRGNTKYKNVTYECIKMYLNLCLPCQKKAKKTNKRIGGKAHALNDRNSCASQFGRHAVPAIWWI